MRRAIVAIVVICLIPLPLLAIDLGRAEGALTVNNQRIDLVYAYAIGKQKNDITNRKDDIRIILTDKPLPEGTDLSKVDYNFPEGILGVVICIDVNKEVSHVIVQHPSGTYDAGYFEGVPDYRFRQHRAEEGAFAGNVSSKSVATATMTFSYDADFVARMQ